MPDNLCKFVAVMSVALGLAACGEKPEAMEQAGGAPSKAIDAATQVGLSTGGQAGAMLNAPGNYVRGLVGDVDRAEKAAALAGKTAEERVNMDPAKDDGN